MFMMLSSRKISLLLPLPNRGIVLKDSATQFCFLGLLCINSFSSSSSNKRSSKVKHGRGSSLAVSYLINSCGLSPESALSASKRLHFETLERPNAMLALLRDHGFTSAHISKLVKVFPALLLADPQNNILPKLQFFYSIGFSRADLGKLLSDCPTILSRSLENQIIPCYNFFKSLVHHDQKLLFAFKLSARIFMENVEKNIAPNIAFLRELGVPEKRIIFFVTYTIRAVQVKHDRFQKIVKDVLEMEFNPLKAVFVNAIRVRIGMKESTWEQKLEVYRRWGWTDEEILELIKNCPMCMSISVEKIMSGMDFLVNKMGWTLGAIARYPTAICLSVEKTLIPRCSVMKVLLLNGLVKKDLGLGSFLKPNKKIFLCRFVFKYEKDIPELFSVYQGKLGFHELALYQRRHAG